MATWSGWQSQLLNAAREPVTATNVAFLNLWAAHADAPGCANNPIDLSHKETGSTNCQPLTPTRTAQKYANHATAATAYATEIHSGNFPILATLLGGGKVNLTTGDAQVEAELNKWGSTNFSTFLAGNATPSGRPSPGIHRGWTELRKSVGTSLPGALSESGRLTRSALRSLSHARKVKI